MATFCDLGECVIHEELIVGKRTVEDTETVRETVRREEADIDGAEEMYGQHNDWGNNMEQSDDNTRNLDSQLNNNQNVTGRMNRGQDFDNASSLDARMNEGRNQEGLASFNEMNMQNNEYGEQDMANENTFGYKDENIDSRDRLDEELEKRRAEMQAKNNNPFK